MTDYLSYTTPDWSTAEKCLQSLIYRYEDAWYYCDDAQYWTDSAYTYYYAANYNTALLHSINAVKNTYQAVQNLIYQNLDHDSPYNLTYFLENYVGVTWQSICAAWIKDDFEGRAWTIACIDRMRQILWDEPFEIIWAAKPEKREGEL